MQNEDRQDLTRGNTARKLAAFAFPILLANLLQAFYSAADMIAVGWFVGETGMAAVSNASMLSFIMNSICIGLTAGGTVLTAQYKGAGDRGGQCRTAATVLYASLAASAAVGALGMAAYRPIFRIMDVPPEAMGDACGYMGIVCLSICPPARLETPRRHIRRLSCRGR